MSFISALTHITLKVGIELWALMASGTINFTILHKFSMYHFTQKLASYVGANYLQMTLDVRMKV